VTIDRIVSALLGVALLAALITGARVLSAGFLSIEAVGALSAALLVSLSTAMHAFASARVRSAARVAWILAMLIALGGPICATLAAAGADLVKDVETVFAFATITLTFPSGFVGPVVIAGLNGMDPESTALQSPAFRSLLLWIPAALAGALQWFVMLPWIVRRFRKG
jgi:hypothetical protein